MFAVILISGNLFAEEIGKQPDEPENNVEEDLEEEVTEEKAKEKATTKVDSELGKFGFGPALYLIQYDEEVLADSKDVRIRGDGSVASNGSEYSVTLGVELHYDFSFGHKLKCYRDCKDTTNWNVTSSHRISPFIGLFDVDNGINGMAAGIIYGYTKGDRKNENKTTLNFGAGKVIHKDRLTLSNDVEEGEVPPTEFAIEDYTERKDIKGLTFMISVNFGF